MADPRTDEWWRTMFARRNTALGRRDEPVQRHASEAGAIPPMCPDLPSEDADYVPDCYVNAGRVPDSWFVCMDIWNAS